MTESNHPEDKPTPEQESDREPKVINAENLFAGEKEVWIDHAGERYRLRITRRGKLILQK